VLEKKTSHRVDLEGKTGFHVEQFWAAPAKPVGLDVPARRIQIGFVFELERTHND